MSSSLIPSLNLDSPPPRRPTWLPFTNLELAEKEGLITIARAQGPWLFDTRDRAYLDATSSWWCVNLGHSHPRLLRALSAQAQKLQHTMLGGLLHEGVETLSRRLLSTTRGAHASVFYASDGASAVECTLRLVLEFHALTNPRRTSMLSLSGAYHGDTSGAVSLGFSPVFHASLEGQIQKSLQASAPQCRACPYGLARASCEAPCFESMERMILQHHETLAAVWIEPLCQGASGVHFYSPQYLRKLDALCHKLGVLWVADEIAVGYGRTGRFWACEHAGVMPDFLICGKGMSGGYLPLSAVLIPPQVYDAFRGRTFYYGHTFTGNPLGCALANEVLNVYEETSLLAQLPLESFAEKWRSLWEAHGDFFQHPISFDTLGMMSALYVSVQEAPKLRAIAHKAREFGLWIRPLGETLYLWPPLNLSPEELLDLFLRLHQTLEALKREA